VKIAAIFQSFKNNKFRYGGYAALVTAVVLALLILVNLVAEQIPLKWDLSENQWFTLSPQTHAALDRLKQPVTIYGLYQAGKEDALTTEILKKYRDRSQRITIKTIDPVRNPGFVRQYSADGADLGEGSLIVASGKRFKTIPAEDLFNYDNSDPAGRQVTSLALEQRVTGAIMYLISNHQPVVYALRGHQEEPLADDVAKQLETENYTVKELSLFTGPIPNDAKILMVVSPKQDLTADEAGKIRSFLERNGRAIFLMDLTRNQYPNFQSLFQSYGVAIQRLMIVEADSTMNAGNPVFLLPKFADQPIVNPLRQHQMPVLIPGAQAIRTLDIKKRTVTVEPLLLSSGQSWGQTDFNATSFDKKPSDPAGPFTVAAAVTDQTGDGSEATKIVLVSSAMFLSPEFTGRVPGNVSLLTNSLNWLSDQKEGLSIQPKSLLSLRLALNGFQSLLFSAVVVILIPCLVLGAGLMVWLRRRHL
jgi:ABC-2 type transport system permease protein